MSFLKDTGAISVMDYLRSDRDNIKSIAFYTECHQTPGFYSMTHKNVPFSFPDCSPYFDGRITETH